MLRKGTQCLSLKSKTLIYTIRNIKKLVCGEVRDKYVCKWSITDGNFWTIFRLLYFTFCFILLYLYIVFQTQTILSLLAEIDCVHVIASIDHINAPLSE